MKPLILSADQVRLSCQADAFLRGLVCEKFKPKDDVDFHVGLHPIKDGVRMNLGTKIGEHSFMVCRPFGSHDGTSQIFWSCEEMVVELTRSIEDVTREVKREDLVTDESTEYTRANWPNEWAPPRGLVDCCNCPNGRCSIVPDDDEIEDDLDDSDYDDDNIGGEHAPY